MGEVAQSATDKGGIYKPSTLTGTLCLSPTEDVLNKKIKNRRDAYRN